MKPSDRKNGSPNPESRRTTLLSFLCILSFIGSGFSFLSYFSMGMSFETLRSLVFETDTYEAYFAMAPNVKSSMELMFSLPRWYFLLSGLLYAASFAGALLMWRLRRVGFHTYTIAQCLLILLGMLVVPGAGVPYAGILWTGLFVAGYASNLKHMNN
ncbi:MAG: hypothetical protein NC048_00675 [Bacteroides sp.]|nr:hypothetical protein [Ruminococcus flavefaciens]MCM1553994.1 hypothetical protein [Bacteroides sp.]